MKVHTIHNYGDTTVAELALGLVIAAARPVGEQHRVLRGGGWTKLQEIELRGKRIGLEVVVWNRSPVADPAVRSVDLDALLATSDVVSLHLGLNEETRLFMNVERRGRLKPGAILVNTARGGLLDEVALVEALRSGAIGHAGLDVFGTEPLPADHPLRSAPNVTLTAHCGFWTERSTTHQVHAVLDIVKKLFAAAPGADM